MHQFLPEYNSFKRREAQLIRPVLVSVIPRIAFMIRTWEALLHLITVFEPHAIRRSSGACISESALELNDAAWVRFVRHHGAAASSGTGRAGGNQRPLYWADETAAPQDMGSQDRLGLVLRGQQSWCGRP